MLSWPQTCWAGLVVNRPESEHSQSVDVGIPALIRLQIPANAIQLSTVNWLPWLLAALHPRSASLPHLYQLPAPLASCFGAAVLVQTLDNAVGLIWRVQPTARNLHRVVCGLQSMRRQRGTYHRTRPWLTFGLFTLLLLLSLLVDVNFNDGPNSLNFSFSCALPSDP